jgi:hypothetical protein
MVFRLAFFAEVAVNQSIDANEDPGAPRSITQAKDPLAVLVRCLDPRDCSVAQELHLT